MDNFDMNYKSSKNSLIFNLPVRISKNLVNCLILIVFYFYYRY